MEFKFFVCDGNFILFFKKIIQHELEVGCNVFFINYICKLCLIDF